MAERRPALRRFARWAWVTAAATWLLLALGAAVIATGSGLACAGWPLCVGRVVPALSGPVAVEWIHRVGAVAVTVLTLATAGAALPLRKDGPWLMGCVLAIVLLMGQVVLGALLVDENLAAPLLVAHQAVGSLFLGVWIALAAAAGR